MAFIELSSCIIAEISPQTLSAMLSCTLKLSGSRLPTIPMPPNLAYVTKHKRTYPSSGACVVKSICPCADLEPRYPRKIAQSCKGVNVDLFSEPNLKYESQVYGFSLNQESVDNVNDKEIRRRIKIGQSNKGKVPWNKGLKHSEETRERISLRTKEALKDPKVRKKMSRVPRALSSSQTKSNISASLTRLWGVRKKQKMSKEKFLQSWVESISEAAKRGGSDEQELDWDSYDKLKQEIALLQIHETAEKAKVKAERAAGVKAEKTARLAQKRTEREENVKAKGGSFRKMNKKSKEEKERLAQFQEEKLKERLMKIHKKKSAVNQVSSQHQRHWEKFDLDFAKGWTQEVSLADQIRFARSRRSEQLPHKL